MPGSSATPPNSSSPPGLGRRSLFKRVAVTTAAAIAPAAAATQAPNPISRPRERSEVVLEINGQKHRLELEPRVTLLDALREVIGLTGTKKGCNHGQCGACTVLVNGTRVVSCLTLAHMAQGKKITTIEGLAATVDSELHPLQQEFIEQDAFQCGFCTSGQIMSGVGCISEGHTGDEAEIREHMSGNLCRCAAYPNIVTAIKNTANQS